MRFNLRADAGRLEKFAALTLQRCGVPAADAALTAHILIDTDLRGIDTHGVMNLRGTYVDRLRAGLIKADPRLTTHHGSPTTAVVDGDNGLGFLAAHRAMEEAIAMATTHGSGWVSVRHSNHCGAGAFYVLMAARRDMVGLHFSSGGSTVAGPGGRGKLIGNNVVALAAPAGRYPPFVFDMAPTMAIANKARLHLWDGEPMPPGALTDAEGRDVLEPLRYFDADVAVRPLGATLAQGVHKGFGLLLMSDILTGMLSGDGGSLLREKGAESHFFGAMRIDAFVSPTEFKRQMATMIAKLHAAPLAAGGTGLRYPGERAERELADRRARGIPLHPRLADELRQLATELGVDFESVWLP